MLKRLATPTGPTHLSSNVLNESILRLCVHKIPRLQLLPTTTQTKYVTTKNKKIKKINRGGDRIFKKDEFLINKSC